MPFCRPCGAGHAHVGNDRGGLSGGGGGRLRWACLSELLIPERNLSLHRYIIEGYFLKGNFVKAVLGNFSQLCKLTVYYRSLQAILPKHTTLSPVLTMCA